MGLSKNFILKKIGKDYTIIPINSNNVEYTSIFNTNETGAFIYGLLEKEKSFDEILEELKKEYNAPEDVLKKDLEEFINKLKERHIYE